MTLKRVVITGLGAITPIGNSVAAYWQGLISGKSGAAPITRFDPSQHRTRFACEVKSFDPMNYGDKKEMRKMDRYCHLALAAAEEAMKDAAIPLDKVNRNKMGVIWASGIGGLESFEEEVMSYGAGDKTPRFNPFFIPKMISNMAAGHIAMRYGFHGVNFAPVSACAASTNAIIDAFNYIRLGKATIILSGGSEAAITASGIGGFNAMKALSERNEAPELASRPFDKDRDGFVLGEGAGALILEEMEHALHRGAKIYGEIVGGGCSSDAYHMTATHPEGLGASLAMQEALDEAGLSCEDIDYLNVHATSTGVGDPSEMKAIEKVFGTHIRKLQISATKSMTGHLLGAAGAIESIACLLSIQHQLVPPTINLNEVDPVFPDYLQLTPLVAITKKVEVAMSNTFGFGGHNAIALFKKFKESERNA
jgi:3-oxoacyl-[acyl-carrier-protein] synthase II